MRRCVFCQRPLKSKKARRLGVGGTCARKFTFYTAQRKLELAGQLRLFDKKSGAERRRSHRRAHKESREKIPD